MTSRDNQHASAPRSGEGGPEPAPQQQSIPTDALPRTLILPDGSTFFDVRVCGLPLLVRLVCALDRATGGVHILRTPPCTDSIVRDFDASAAARSRKPRVCWEQSTESIPSSAGLFVVTRPGVFDQRLCSDVDDFAERDDLILRYRRPGEEDALVWFVGRNRVATFLRWLAEQSDVSGAMTRFTAGQSVRDIDPGRDVCEVIHDDDARRDAEEKLLGFARKESDTWIARNFDRNVSMLLTRALVALPISPNQVTLIATACGLLGALCLALGTYLPQLVGSFLLVLSIIIDGCDGEVARLKYMESEFGRRLDFFLDNVVNVLAIFTVGAGHYWQGGPSFYLYASLANAGAAFASIFPVYWVFFRSTPSPARQAGPRKTGLEALAENVAGRDYVYLVFVLAIVGRAHWFTFFCLAGIGVFFVIMVVLFVRKALSRNGVLPAAR